jgi:hypothetical protein
MMVIPRRPTAERLADEAPLAVGAVLFHAHERARALEHQLELEAADPRVDVLYRQSKALRKSIAALLVEGALTATPAPGTASDCAECLTGVDRCELDASLGQGRCCSTCSHA